MKEFNVKGLSFLIDDEDLEKVSALNWCVNNKGYATAAICDGAKTVYSMHEWVFGKAPEGCEIHHKDNNRHNNQKINLEYLTVSTHRSTRGLQRNNCSGYKGVCFDKLRLKWTASISIKGKSVFLGRYSTAEEAAKVYDKKALEVYGSYVKLNFPKPKITKELLAALSNPNI